MLEILLQQNFDKEIYFYDDVNKDAKTVYENYKILKTQEEVETLFQLDNEFCLGVGGVLVREKIFSYLLSFSGKPSTIISPYSHIGKNKIFIGDASTIATGAIITTNVSIGTGCLINLNCTIGHGSVIGKFCELSPGVHISGNCTIQDYCSIGTGAVILPNLSIGKNVTIGAGAVITKSISDGQRIVGVPGKPMDN